MRCPIQFIILITAALFACFCTSTNDGEHSTTNLDHSTTYLDDCETDDDCSGDLICEPVLSSEYALNPDDDLTMDEYLEQNRDGDNPDEEYVYPACTLSCEVDEDCPESNDCNGTDWCVAGVCSASNCA